MADRSLGSPRGMVQKEAGSHFVDLDGALNTDGCTYTISASSAQKHVKPRKRKIIIISAITMVAITALALGLGLGLGLTNAKSTTQHSVPPEPSPSSDITSNGNAFKDLGLKPGTTFDYPLGFSLTTSNANKTTKFYPVDLENTPKTTIGALTEAGHTIVCYFSAGSVESYRADAGDIPKDAVGKTLEGWEDERWLDVRNQGVRDVMAKRIRTAADKGCVGVDPDNIDGYQNDSGFDLTADDAVDFVAFLSETAHAAGLAVGLKNGGDIVERVVDMTEWAINEQCAEYGECDSWAPFIDAGKPVFHVEYTADDDATSVSASQRKKACSAGGNSGFSSIIKHMSLDDWIVYC
ncbi:glycoside hydrolase superfamily [Xylariaceae sp. FL0594]|nr:glycoside hydrolase superfamily [Xylariaceae sp. FL0594]